MVGKSLSHYEIEDKLGEGGMGEVYRASDTKLRRSVALKILPPAFAGDPERMARFQREAQVLASLNHPHIGQIFGLEEDSGTHALVLELIEGPTLGDRIRAGRIPSEEIFRIAMQIAQALEVAHEQGIIHRDLKPENVKITEAGQVKVLDFGLAKAMEANSSDIGNTQSPTMSPAITGAMTAANVILGTAGYMSPEQARGQAVDRRADIWAFGVVLFEMMTARRLFTGDTVSDTLAAVLRLDPDWDALPPDTPSKVRRLLRRCLERNPDQRLRDIGDARIALQEVLAGDLEEPEVVAAPEASGPPRRAFLAGLMAVAIGALLGGFFAGRSSMPSAPEVPLVKFRIPVPDLLTSLGFGGTTLAISPDGARVVYTSEDKLWIRDLSEIEPRELPGTNGAVVPFWSPDGEWIGYGDNDRLFKVRANGGAPLTLCELDDGFSPASGGAWTSDGRIAFATGSGPLMTVSAQGGDPDTLLALVPDADTDFHNVTALPDDRGLIFVVHRDGEGFDRIDLLTADGERREVLFTENENISFPVWDPSGHIVFHREPTNPGIWAVPFSLSSLSATGEPFLVIPNAALHSVSRTGTMVLALGDFSDSNQLVWADRNGLTDRKIGLAQDQDTYFRLSPDGDRLALRVRGEDTDVYIVDVVRETQTRLTFSEGIEGWPLWTRDGARVYYQRSEDFPEVEMWMRHADGSGEPVRIGPGGWACLSPDEKHLVVSVNVAPSDWDLYTYELGADGLPVGEAELFLDTSVVTWHPQLSPDGRYVAYHSDDDGTQEIFLKPFPKGSGKWQISVDGGFWARWKADGSEVYYVDGNDMMAVSVELDPVRLGTPRVLFSRPESIGVLPFGWPDAYEVTPDGERFIVAIRPEGHDHDAERGLVVAQNWFAEIEGRE